MRKIFFILSTFLILSINLPVYAHWADMSAMEININSNKADAVLTMPTPFLLKFDDDKNGKISVDEINKYNKEIKELFKDNVYLVADNEKLEADISGSEASDVNIAGTNNQTTLKLNWALNQEAKSYKIHYSLFPQEAINAHCLISAIVNGESSNFTLNQNKTDAYLKELTVGETIKQFVLLGIEHIATGYDHILFLVALLLAGGGFAYLLKIVTAFTLAHSITLSLAVLGIVNISSQLIESCIAASIIFVAIENIRKKKSEAHWSLVFGFGLIHGLGFANILREMDIQGSKLVYTLVSFNLGIEMGQLVIVTIAWFLLNQIYKSKENIYSKIKTGGSVAIGLIATVWFIERAFLGM